MGLTALSKPFLPTVAGLDKKIQMLRGTNFDSLGEPQ